MMQKILRQLKLSLGRGAKAPQPQAPTAPQQRLTQHIAIDGAKQVLVPASFLKAYGVDPRAVVATAVVTPGAMTAEAAFALKEVYREGGTRGPDTAGLAMAGRALQAHERLYFVLVTYRPSKTQSLLAFVAPEAAGSSRSLG